MRISFRYTLAIFTILLGYFFALRSNASINLVSEAEKNSDEQISERTDTLATDSVGKLPYPLRDNGLFGNTVRKDSSALFLDDPSNIKRETEYDPVTKEYIIRNKIGDINYRLPESLKLEEYTKQRFEESLKRYWRKRISEASLDQENQYNPLGKLIPQLRLGGESFNNVFGANTVNIRPQGFVELSLGVQTNRIDNPAIPEKMRKTTTFDFDQKLNVSVVGEIGDKLSLKANYNTEATFGFENRMKLDFNGEEDDIVKKVEAGNVSLPLSGNLISGGTNLRGVRTDLQFGRLSMSTILSQQKGETTVIETEGGAQKTRFEIDITDYDANRHFFFAHHFYESYDKALENLPVINSQITINKIEVWVTNRSNNFKESRNILALLDLGEISANKQNTTIPEFGDAPGLTYPYNIFPHNDINGLYKEMTTTYSDIRDVSRITEVLEPLKQRDFVGGRDYEKIENARRLSPSEYTVNTKLGYISLASALRADEVLAVAIQYTANGEVFQLGEFSSDGIDAPKTLILKLLKGTNLNPEFKNWRLMMKNIYNLGAYQLSPDDFRLDVTYKNDSTGSYLNYLPTGPVKEKILLKLMNLDNLNKQKDPYPDGIFDYIEEVTVNSSKGKIIFPVVEPFGSNLEAKLQGDQAAINRYVYKSLYTTTKTVAKQDAENDKYRLEGSYKGASNAEIPLNTVNVSRGSVKVLSGGRELTEGVDYIVDYALGRVKIINQGLLESGTPIRISTESEELFSMQQKSLVGTHLNYQVNKKLNFGATAMYLHEKPLTQKVNLGEDPISNLMLGFNANYKTKSQFITNVIDALPFIRTNAESKIAIDAEWARLLPGHSKVISREGAAYIDDFEGTKTTIDMRIHHSWHLASTPQGQQLFPEGDLINDFRNGYNRARLAWYIIDPVLQRNTKSTPPHFKQNEDQRSSHYVREVYQSEIFPERDYQVGMPTNLPTLDLAFYPEEKGPYNFETNATTLSSGINADGTLRIPESRWGGIMRKIETSDFEAANIEYIEFWLMDPFAEDSLMQNPGGHLYFNLGNISEDILRDGRKSFENGLAADGDYSQSDTTIWGRVSTKQSLVHAFDNNPRSRMYQDIGLNGLNSDEERSYYSGYLGELGTILDGDALSKANQDPASDDYHYFRGSDYDEQELGILERYKLYNNPEGNSPTDELSPEPYSTAATSIPNAEDINSDNTLNETEAYFQYRVDIDRENLQIGKNFITDIKKAEVKLRNGKRSVITWYQFKIPVQTPQEVIGPISDFRSIRFIRMFLKDWQKPVVMRFATLDLVRADWRKYTKDLSEDNKIPSQVTQFDVSAVNIEENANRKPVNYVLPPGLDRVIDPANPQVRELNEQSMVMKVNDLEEGDSRGAYKTTMLDMRRYKSLKLEVHAEEIEGYQLDDDELHLFLRLGSDFRDNYYEYEIPLKLTPHGIYDNKSEIDRLKVWPEENRMYIPLDMLPKLKMDRNAEMRRAGSYITLRDIYERVHGGVNGDKNILKVKGNPNLSEVEVIMVGIRNKSGMEVSRAKSVEAWINELRLTDFEEEGGWAATGRIAGNLADLGSYSFSGRTSTTGFGSLDSKMGQRSIDDSRQYDVSANVEWGKFFGEKSGVHIPMYVSYSEAALSPEFNPLDPDVKMKDALEAAADSYERDSIKNIAQDFSTRKSINFTNVKIDKNKKGRPKIYDISNLDLTYSYNEYLHRDINTKINSIKNTRALLSYNYNNQPKPVEPFKKLFKSNALALVRDFNFNLLPNMLSFRSDMNRRYSQLQFRNISNPDFLIPSSFEKDFLWARSYDFSYNITRGLKMDFSALNTSRIDEPLGAIEKDIPGYEARRDTILQNILDGGRNIHYHHTLNGSYSIPVNKIPLFNWVNTSVSYQGTYDWDAAPITNSDFQLGNIIRNSRALQGNVRLDFVRFYNKVSYLKKINQQYSGRGRGRVSSPGRSPRGNRFIDDKLSLKSKSPASIVHKLGTKTVVVRVTDRRGKIIEGETKIVNRNKVVFIPDEDHENARVLVTGKPEQKDNPIGKAVGYTSRFLMMLRNINLSYTTTEGTVLPGYLPGTHLFGMSSLDQSGTELYSMAPGWPFILGHQDPDFVYKAIDNGWLTKDSVLNQPYMMTQNRTIQAKSDIEPFPGLKITVNANQIKSENQSEFFIYNEADGWNPHNKNYYGNYSMTIISIGSSFEKLGKNGVQQSDSWDNFQKYREEIAWRLTGNRVPNSDHDYNPGDIDEETGFPDGYGPTSPEVLIPAFLAAYTGNDPNKISLDPFPSLKFIMPNWQVRYNGMVNKIALLKGLMKSMGMSHSYRSTYNVGSFLSNLAYMPEDDGFSYVRDFQNNFVPLYNIAAVSINETFNPLFDIDVTWINNLTTRVEFRKSRNLTLSLTNNQTTEVYNNETSFGFGYRFENMKLFIKTKDSQKSVNNDLHLMADLQFSKNKTVLRKLVEENDQVTSGQDGLTLKISADYNLSNVLMMRLFYDRVINTPYISLSYPSANTNIGVSFRLSLNQF